MAEICALYNLTRKTKGKGNPRRYESGGRIGKARIQRKEKEPHAGQRKMEPTKEKDR